MNTDSITDLGVIIPEDEFIEMEMTLAWAGMPTYSSLLSDIVSIIDPPVGQEWEERQAYLVKVINTAKQHVTTAMNKQKLDRVNERLQQMKAYTHRTRKGLK